MPVAEIVAMAVIALTTIGMFVWQRVNANRRREERRRLGIAD
jgi:hypothetical protein